MRILWAALAAALLSAPAHAFCGFYVARADGQLFNESSKVVFLRDGQRSVITISSDYRGPASEFALVLPAPVVLEEDQIATVKGETVAHLDAYSAPRLVEYHDPDPCAPLPLPVMALADAAVPESASPPVRRGPDALGVTIEAEYAIGVYDVAILSAQESDGLATWLRQENYNIPDGAERVLGVYIGRGMKFFVARVNLERHAEAETTDLPPIQLSFDTSAFMLPLQLGKINADGHQDVLVLALSRQGRIEAENYANARIPSEIGVPGFVRDRFGEFYRGLYQTAAAPDTVLTEYAWDMAWCDPCAADPLSAEQLRELGASWVKMSDQPAQDVFVTRLHFRYTADQFQEDLVMRETEDRQNFQGRYIIRNPYDGSLQCENDDRQAEADAYLKRTRARLTSEAATLERLTGWDRGEIDAAIAMSVPEVYTE